LRGKSLAGFDERFEIAKCGPSFHSRKPMAELDRIIVDREFSILEAGVHYSEAAQKASDHLPIWARISPRSCVDGDAGSTSRSPSPRDI
jgi:endonuclease/exonuclease/phosphatase family metal-dependent hydrolase